MKLRFKHQPYQTDAVHAVADVFAGQPKSEGARYTLDPGRRPELPAGPAGEGVLTADAVDAMEVEAFANTTIALNPHQLLDNLRTVQRRNGLPPSKDLATSPACTAGPNLDIEMETGTGKTYCYIKTCFELYERYGWQRFIVVVPSSPSAKACGSRSSSPPSTSASPMAEPPTPSSTTRKTSRNSKRSPPIRAST